MEPGYVQMAGQPTVVGRPFRMASTATSPQPFVFDSLELPSDEEAASLGLEVARDVEITVRIELGRTELPLDDVAALKQGSVVPLDKLANDPVDILVNNRIIARGEVLVLNDTFCVRIAEILAPGF